MVKVVSVIFVALYMIVLNSCSSKYELFQQKPEETKKEEIQKQQLSKQIEEPVKVIVEYKIAPGDRLSIVVFRHPELSTRKFGAFQQDLGLLVSQKGTIILPLIGEVKVQGLTKYEAANMLKKEFSKYIKNPNVYVEILNQRVYVVGEVNRPGPVQFFDDRITLIEALARAGDFNIYAKRDKVMIIRGNLSNPTVITVDLTDINQVQAAGMILQPNDIVYVPPNKMRKVNVVIGQISPPIRLISEILQPFVQIKFLSQ